METSCREKDIASRQKLRRKKINRRTTVWFSSIVTAVLHRNQNFAHRCLVLLNIRQTNHLRRFAKRYPDELPVCPKRSNSRAIAPWSSDLIFCSCRRCVLCCDLRSLRNRAQRWARRENLSDKLTNSSVSQYGSFQ